MHSFILWEPAAQVARWLERLHLIEPEQVGDELLRQLELHIPASTVLLNPDRTRASVGVSVISTVWPLEIVPLSKPG